MVFYDYVAMRCLRSREMRRVAVATLATLTTRSRRRTAMAENLLSAAHPKSHWNAQHVQAIQKNGGEQGLSGCCAQKLSWSSSVLRLDRRACPLQGAVCRFLKGWSEMLLLVSAGGFSEYQRQLTNCRLSTCVCVSCMTMVDTMMENTCRYGQRFRYLDRKMCA